jgi:hypothetical protein
MFGRISTIIAIKLRKVSKKLAEFITKHPNISMLIASIIASAAMLIFPNITPMYCDKIAIRTMLTNAVGLFALLTFATNQLSNISRKTKDDTYLGINIKYFLALQSPHNHIISGNIFRSEIILLFIFPVLAFEFPTLTQYVTRLWWGVFSTVASLLAWNLINSLRVFDMTELHRESVVSQIELYQCRMWSDLVAEIIELRQGDAGYTTRKHKEYLKEYAEIDSSDRCRYKLLTLGNLRPVSDIISNAPSKKTLKSTCRFIYGRQKALIEKLLDPSSSIMQPMLFELIHDTDLKYKMIAAKAGADSAALSKESGVELTEFSLGAEPPQSKGAELIPAFLHHKISEGICNGRIKPTANEVSSLITSINSITHQETKEYAARQLIDAITADLKLFGDISGTIPCLIPGASPVDDNEKLWRNLMLSVSQQKVIEKTDLPVEEKKTLLQNTSKEFRIAYLFLMLFQEPTFSISENKDLLEYLSSVILEDSSGSTDECFEGLDSETQEAFGIQKIDFEQTKEVVSSFLATSDNFDKVRSEESLVWLFGVLTRPVTYDLYEEFENRNFGTLFAFSKAILWKEVVTKDQCAKLDFLGELDIEGAFFNESDRKPDSQESDEKIHNAKAEVDEAASMLEQLGRTEDAKRLRQSIVLK